MYFEPILGVSIKIYLLSRHNEEEFVILHQLIFNNLLLSIYESCLKKLKKKECSISRNILETIKKWFPCHVRKLESINLIVLLWLFIELPLTFSQKNIRQESKIKDFWIMIFFNYLWFLFLPGWPHISQSRELWEINGILFFYKNHRKRHLDS
jgi:hypothetical protein